ncbi:hypothetical protein GGI15_001018 [Coemansia interrupta]|uniref:Uncharacterized protein n=1 Tax=Coemansia interrupta TaxID=1126814 RepID=A0A9W8LNC5_9FUNG|nr:hypothetical protein GGI15_001018 [Coemansia interrupta]
MAVNKPLPATPGIGADELVFIPERPSTARHKSNNTKRPKHPPVQPSYYNSRLAPLRSNSSLPLPLAYHGEYQGVPIIDDVATTPVLTKRRTNVDNESESDAGPSAGLHSAPLAIPNKPKERSYQIESEQESDPECDQGPRHQSEPESAPNPQSRGRSKRRSKPSAEASADAISKRPSTSHGKTRKSSKNKRSSKAKSRSVAETVLPEMPVLKTPPALVAEANEPTASSEGPEETAPTNAGNEASELEAPAELPTPPLSTEARPSTAAPLVEQRVARPRPLTALAGSSKPRARPQTVNLASEPVKTKHRPETAGPTVSVPKSKPKARPATITQMDASKMRPVTTGQLTDSTDRRPATSKSQRKSRSRPTTSQFPQRPRTAMQPGRDRPQSEWRDIHVQSLSRVDSILRAAVGLDSRGGSRSSSSSRRSTYVADTSEPLPTNNGLGISIPRGPSGSQQRPETAYTRMTNSLKQRSGLLSSPTELSMESVSHSFQDISLSSGQRPRTTGATFDAPAMPQRSSSRKEVRRGNSVYSDEQQQQQRQRPATSHSGRRQPMSMYNLAPRQIQLSRDEDRRSRLFAEYEKLVGSKSKSLDDDDDDDDDDELCVFERQSVSRPTTTKSSKLALSDDSLDSDETDATPKVSLDNIAEEEEEVDKDGHTDFAPSSSAELSEATFNRNSNEDVFASRHAMDQESRPRPSSVYVKSSPSLLEGKELGRRPSIQQSRHAHSNSLHSPKDVFSKQQSQKRWTQMLSKNQHLFDIEAVVAAGALGGRESVDANAVADVAVGTGKYMKGEEEEEDEEAMAAIDDVISLASNDCESGDEASAEAANAKRMLTQSLTLDLPPAVDLFEDVTQALAERMPLSANGPGENSQADGSQTSGNPHSRPLAAMPLYSPKAFSAFGVNIFGGKDRVRTPLAESTHIDDVDLPPETESKANKRNSIYINHEDIYNSTIFAGDELPYQQENPPAETAHIAGQVAESAVTPMIAEVADAAAALDYSAHIASRTAGEYTPTMPVGILPNEYNRREPKGPIETLKHSHSQAVLQTQPDVPSSDSRPTVTGRSGDSTIRHSEYVRQQLQLVEDSTPPGALGQVLSKRSEPHREMLQAYMKRFDFHDLPIDFALRQLFQKLHLPPESQQIDIVITGFAEHYHHCNPGVFFSSEIVYSYSFAVLLLHTDAHNPQVKQKMTKAQFISQAKLLDVGDEMFEEVLDILYDNVTMVRFEYAPTAPLGNGARPQTADVAPRDHSQGISGWLRRMFAPAMVTSAPVQSPVPLSPQGIPNKQQYSYTTLSRRAMAQGTQMPSPALSRPTTANALFSPTSPEAADTVRGRAHTTTNPSMGVSQASPVSPVNGFSPVSSPPAAQVMSGFTAADITASTQPVAIETIRLSSLKSHVKRRPSLRQGRPLSGIVTNPPNLAAAKPNSQDSMAQLRVDMSGHVLRKIERQENGRRALVRRWKNTYLVLSGSRLYFLRPDTGSLHDQTQAQGIMSIVPLRHGVAIVDSQYNKYPHVFRVLAGDGSQILIKASDDDSVAEWMAQINCAAAFKSMDVARREKPIMSDPARARLLEERLLSLDEKLSAIDDKLERFLRLFKQLAMMVPLTKASRTKIVHHADQVREKLSEIYLDDQRLTCYKDVLQLDLTIEYELGAHDKESPHASDWDRTDDESTNDDDGQDPSWGYEGTPASTWDEEDAPSTTWD